MEVKVLRCCVRNRFGNTKTESSCRPVPLHPIVLNALINWRARSRYASEVDFLFLSIRLNSTKPVSQDSLLQRSVRAALARAGIVGKRIGWHSFRHSLATNLRMLGVDIKVAQELLRHSSCPTTLDVYTRAVSQQKREANSKVVEMMLPMEVRRTQHPSAPSEQREATTWMSETSQTKQVSGGPDRDRTDDLFHAMEARSQTAPQAHWLQGCNFSIVSAGAGFVKLCLFKAWKAAPWHGSRFIKESKTCVTGNTLGVLRCLT